MTVNEAIYTIAETGHELDGGYISHDTYWVKCRAAIQVLLAEERERAKAESLKAYRRGCPECEDGFFDYIEAGRGLCRYCGGVADIPAIAPEAPCPETEERQNGR